MVTLFLTVYCLGAAAVGVWFDARYPGLRPRSVTRLVVVVVAGTIVAPLLPELGRSLFGPVVLYIMLPCFAALVLCFVVLAWTARFCAGLVGR